jgi:hypothetical protein
MQRQMRATQLRKVARKHGRASPPRTPEYSAWINLRNRARRKGEAPPWADYPAFLEAVGPRPDARHRFNASTGAWLLIGSPGQWFRN